MVDRQCVQAVHQRGLKYEAKCWCLVTEILDTYCEEDGENCEVDDREMRGEPVGEGDFTHVREILQEIVCTVTENSGEYCEKGEEEGGPVGDVGEEEVVDMNSSLGGEDKVY